MTRSKIAAFFEEFPFLRTLFNENNVQEVRVSRVNEETADVVPEYKSLKTDLVSGFYGQYPHYVYEWTRLFLLDENGSKLAEVGIVLKEYNGLDSFQWKKFQWKRKVCTFTTHISESVAGTMARLGDKAKDVHYVVVSEPVFESSDADGKVTTYKKLTLLKSPKGFNVQGWFEEVHRRDAEEFKTILANIDQV